MIGMFQKQTLPRSFRPRLMLPGSLITIRLPVLFSIYYNNTTTVEDKCNDFCVFLSDYETEEIFFD